MGEGEWETRGGGRGVGRREMEGVFCDRREREGEGEDEVLVGGH